jgi:hypothetical protein
MISCSTSSLAVVMRRVCLAARSIGGQLGLRCRQVHTGRSSSRSARAAAVLRFYGTEISEAFGILADVLQPTLGEIEEVGSAMRSSWPGSSARTAHVAPAPGRRWRSGMTAPDRESTSTDTAANTTSSGGSGSHHFLINNHLASSTFVLVKGGRLKDKKNDLPVLHSNPQASAPPFPVPAVSTPVPVRKALGFGFAPGRGRSG